MNKKLSTTLLSMLMAGASTLAFAHTDTPHTKKIGPISNEQKEWGVAGDSKGVTRSITLTMTDNMRFAPDQLEIKQGETIKFNIKNAGAMLHEMVIGTKQVLDKHAAMVGKITVMPR